MISCDWLALAAATVAAIIVTANMARTDRGRDDARRKADREWDSDRHKADRDWDAAKRKEDRDRAKFSLEGLAVKEG